MVKEGHARLREAEAGITTQAAELRARTGKARPDPRPLWTEGEYTTHNRMHN
jgi:hypothetical protein